MALLVGRSAGRLDTGADGRSDVVFGEMYFALPAGTHAYAEEPAFNRAQAVRRPAASVYRADHIEAGGTPGQTLQPSYTTTVPLFVGIQYACGTGRPTQRGDAVVTTYRADGSLEGTALREEGSEYALYSTSTRTSESYPATGRPTTAAIYELRRFGRIVGPDTLAPVDVPYWRRVAYPGGSGWVNLNAANVRKFSDADFPSWRGWALVDDDHTVDSHCGSAAIAAIVYGQGAAPVRLDRQRAAGRLHDSAVSRRLARTICKFPSEWSVSTIEARWSWLKVASDEHPQPLTDEDYAELKAHITALCFPLPELFRAEWCFDPRQFIELFRCCGWLSSDELAQLLPRRHGVDAQHMSEISWATALSRFQPYVDDLNRTMRKYGIVSSLRRTHFLTQTYIETAMWRTMEEVGRGHQQQRRDGTLYWPAPAMEYYQGFHGRGAMQLTWASNFEAYGTYRGLGAVDATHLYFDPRITKTSTHHWADPRDRSGYTFQSARVWWPRFDPQDISGNTFNACDSAAHYWISKNTGGGALNINRVADHGVTMDAVGRVSVLVNGGGYGFFERQAYAPFIERYLGDGTETEPTRTFVATYRGRNHNVYVDFRPQRPR